MQTSDRLGILLTTDSSDLKGGGNEETKLRGENVWRSQLTSWSSIHYIQRLQLVWGPLMLFHGSVECFNCLNITHLLGICRWLEM